MKKLLLILTLFYFSISNAQINNLKDLLAVSELSVYELTDYLQYSWTVSRPTEEFTEDKQNVIERYTFSYYKDNKNQVLQRQINLNLKLDFSRERTNFICNDINLLQQIKTNLPYEGFQLKQNKPHYIVYHDGNRMVAIIGDGNPDYTLSKGYYMVVVFANQ